MGGKMFFVELRGIFTSSTMVQTPWDTDHGTDPVFTTRTVVPRGEIYVYLPRGTTGRGTKPGRVGGMNGVCRGVEGLKEDEFPLFGGRDGAEKGEVA